MTLIEAAAVLFFCQNAPVYKIPEVRKLAPAQIGEMKVVDKSDRFGQLMVGGIPNHSTALLAESDLWIFVSTGTKTGAWREFQRCP